MSQTAKIIQLDTDQIDDSVGSVYVTTDYDKFCFNSKNRQVNPAHVDKLTASIKKNNLLYGQPILVNEDFEIIDGQHRYRAAIRLELPIYYIKHDGLTIEDAITLNINTKNWKWRDYLRYWIDQENPEYITFKEYMDKYGISYSVSCGLLGLGQATSGNQLTDVFNEGRFKCKYLDYGREIGDMLLGLAPYGGFATDRSFVLAFEDVVSNEDIDFDYQVFLKKVKMAPDRFTRCSNVENYLRMMEDVINYHNHGERVRLY